MYTLTSLKSPGTRFISNYHHVYYGPVYIPDLNYFVPLLNTEEARNYLEKKLGGIEGIHVTKVNKELIENLESIFQDNYTLFMSGKGLIRSYVEFIFQPKRFVKKNINQLSTLRENVKRFAAASFFYIHTAEAGKASISLRLNRKDIPDLVYARTDMKPFDIVRMALIHIVRRGSCIPETIIRTYLTFRILEEKRKKKTTIA